MSFKDKPRSEKSVRFLFHSIVRFECLIEFGKGGQTGITDMFVPKFITMELGKNACI